MTIHTSKLSTYFVVEEEKAAVSELVEGLEVG